MDISSLPINKGLLIKGFASLSGISGASSASWYFYDSVNQTGHSKIFEEEYEYNPIVFYSDVTSLNFSKQGSEELNRFNTKKNICAEKYFSIGIVDTAFSELGSGDESTSDLYKSTQVNSGAGNSISGCISMKLSTNGENFVFESETVVKNGDYAIIIWSSSWNFKKILLENKVTLLKKESNGWDIKGGFVLSRDDLKKVTIKSPDSHIDREFSTKTETTAASGSWSYEYYLGIWEDNASGEEFKNLMSWEIDGVHFDSNLDYKLPTTQSDYVYNPVTKKWRKKSEGVENWLEKWFKLFKNKKGTWNAKSSLVDDCKNKSLIRDTGGKPEELQEKYCSRRLKK